MAYVADRPEFRLRPLGMGDLLDETLKLYRSHFRVLVLLALFPLVPFGVLYLIGVLLMPRTAANDFGASTRFTPELATAIGIAVVFGILIVIAALVALSLVNGAVTYAVSQLYLGRRVGVEEAYRAVRPRLLSLIAWPFIVGLIGGLIALVGLIGVGILAAALGTGNNTAVGCLAALGFLVALLALIWAGVKVSLTNVAIVVENLGAWDGIRRSWELVTGHWGRVFLAEFLLSILVGILSLIPSALGGIAIVAFRETTAGQALNVLFSVIGQILFTPITLIGVTLLYYDLRIRKEGFDLEVMAQHLGAERPVPGDYPPGSQPAL